MSSFQALATAIAAQVGTGNITGCATALVLSLIHISELEKLLPYAEDANVLQKFSQVKADNKKALEMCIRDRRYTAPRQKLPPTCFACRWPTG